MAILGDTKAVSLTLLDGVIGNLNPKINNTYNLGTSSLKWANIYATTLNGNATSATTASKLSNTSLIGNTDKSFESLKVIFLCALISTILSLLTPSRIMYSLVYLVQ